MRDDNQTALPPTESTEDAHGVISRRMLLRGGVLTGALGVAAAAQLWQPEQALAVARPRIFSTNAWDAEPPRAPIQVLDSRPTKIIIHHTDTPNSTDFSRAHAFQLARNIQQAHFDRGFDDTGQHFTISRGGYIMAGRHRSKGVLIEGRRHVVGAHTEGENDDSVGIENEGNYTDVQIRQVHYNRLVRMCAYICQQYDIPPRRIYGHRDFNSTACPGDRLYARIPRLRRDVRALL
jgi:hypothetical protein